MLTDIIKSDYAQTTPGNVVEAKYFYFDTEPDPSTELAVVCGGFERCASDFQIQRSYYPWYVLEYPLKGQCRLTVNSKGCSLEKGMIAGFSPGDRHHYKCDFRKPMEHVFIAFTGKKAAMLFKHSKIAQAVSIKTYDQGKADKIINNILESALDKTGYSHELCACYLKTLLLEQANKTERTGRYFSVPEKSYRRCKSYIEENFWQVILPSEVAAACGINVRYMSRLFKRFDNTTPQSYILQLKLNKATNLLLTAEMSIKDIAANVGFEDQYHFSRTFKKKQGLAPRHYRNAHLKIIISK